MNKMKYEQKICEEKIILKIKMKMIFQNIISIDVNINFK